jgi:hypothetical protein
MKLIKELPGVSADLLDNIVSRLIRWGLFDKTLFDKNGILTSKGIQRRYFEITKRRVNPGENLPYLLVSAYNNRVSAHINPVSSGVSVYINPQSKVKESKVNNAESSNKDSVSVGTPPDAPESPAMECSRESNGQSERIDYRKFVAWFNETTRGVFGTLRYPVGDKRQASLRARVREHGKEALFEVIMQACESDFLKGENKNGFVATLDWMVKPSNFNKIMSGNYNNRRRIKLYTGQEYMDAQMKGALPADFERREIDGTLYFVRKADLKKC